MKLDLKHSADDITLHTNALVVPVQPENRSRHQRSGVLTVDGEFVENSISWDNAAQRVNQAPDVPAEDQITDLPGTWMYGGIAYGHFGHFLVDSLARIWALPTLEGEIDGIIFTPKFIGLGPRRSLQTYRDLLKALGIRTPTKMVHTPHRIERLYVPRQGFGMGALSVGSDKFRAYMKSRAGRDIDPKGPERIYISRTRLAPDRGGLMGEPVLEGLLAAEGYAIYHPQLESQADQIAQYKAARDIISVDCSPLHLVGFVGNAGQRVAILTRRSRSVAKSMVNQLKAFNNSDAFEVNTLVRDWVPANSHRAGRSSFGEIDFPKTYEILKAKGMIASETPWPPLTDEQRAADLARIEELHKFKFKALNDTSQPLEDDSDTNS